MRRAFSLIELFAASLCITLLATFVAVPLDAARKESQYTTCLDRLRAVGTATASYTSDDPDGLALPVHPLFYSQQPDNPSFIGAYEWGGKSGIGRLGYVGDLSSILSSRYGTQAGFGPASRPLNAYLYPHGFRDNRVPTFDPDGATRDTQLDLPNYRCPADDGPPLGAHCPDWIANLERSSYDHYGTSYAANIFMTSYVGGGEMASNSPFLRRLSDVPDPARTYNYEENIGRWAWACRREQEFCMQIGLGQGVDPGPTKSIRGWHGKAWTFNHGYVDGHAARAAIFVRGTEDAEGYSLHYMIEEVFDDPAMQKSLQCLIIRGVGWQKDTLPAERIPTGLFWQGFGRPSHEDCVISE